MTHETAPTVDTEPSAGAAGAAGVAGAGAVGGGMARALFAQTFDKLTNAPLQLTDLDAGDKVSKASNACM